MERMGTRNQGLVFEVDGSDSSGTDNALGPGSVGAGSTSGGCGSPSRSPTPNTYELIRAVGKTVKRPRLPPFLMKLYNMVENEATNGLISWSPESDTSFVIWDHNKLATDLLPNYFKHNNFSSFNAQLNIYGFKKVNWERYEYGHYWFRRGRKDWLHNIKRRDQIRTTMAFVENQSQEPSSDSNTLLEVPNAEENLENQISVLKAENRKLVACMVKMREVVLALKQRRKEGTAVDHDMEVKKRKLEPVPNRGMETSVEVNRGGFVPLLKMNYMDHATLDELMHVEDIVWLAEKDLADHQALTSNVGVEAGHEC